MGYAQHLHHQCINAMRMVYDYTQSGPVRHDPRGCSLPVLFTLICFLRKPIEVTVSCYHCLLASFIISIPVYNQPCNCHGIQGIDTTISVYFIYGEREICQANYDTLFYIISVIRSLMMMMITLFEGCQIILTKEMEGMTLTLPKATRNFYVDGHIPTPH